MLRIMPTHIWQSLKHSPTIEDIWAAYSSLYVTFHRLVFLSSWMENWCHYLPAGTTVTGEQVHEGQALGFLYKLYVTSDTTDDTGIVLVIEILNYVRYAPRGTKELNLGKKMGL